MYHNENVRENHADYCFVLKLHTLNKGYFMMEQFYEKGYKTTVNIADNSDNSY